MKENKGISLLILVLTIIAILVIGTVIIFVVKNANTNNNVDSDLTTNKENLSNTNHFNYANSNNTNNITFTWSEQENKVYAINIEEDNINKDLKVNNTSIGNNVFQVTEYKYSANSGLTLKKINNYNLVFSLAASWENKTFDQNREIINENDNQILVHEYLGGDNYVVYIKTNEKYVRISANISDENSANEYFNYINNHIKVATINYEDVDKTYHKFDLSSAKQNNQPIDISSWTFANDLIADIFRNDGLNIKSSSDIKSFFVNNGYTINMTQNIKDSKINYLSYKITSATNGTYDKKDAIMQFNTGSSSWKITNTSNYHNYAKVKTTNGKEYSIEISYNNYDSETIREIIKENIIDYFK